MIPRLFLNTVCGLPPYLTPAEFPYQGADGFTISMTDLLPVFLNDPVARTKKQKQTGNLMKRRKVDDSSAAAAAAGAGAADDAVKDKNYCLDNDNFSVPSGLPDLRRLLGYTASSSSVLALTSHPLDYETRKTVPLSDKQMYVDARNGRNTLSFDQLLNAMLALKPAYLVCPFAGAASSSKSKSLRALTANQTLAKLCIEKISQHQQHQQQQPSETTLTTTAGSSSKLILVCRGGVDLPAFARSAQELLQLPGAVAAAAAVCVTDLDAVDVDPVHAVKQVAEACASVQLPVAVTLSGAVQGSRSMVRKLWSAGARSFFSDYPFALASQRRLLYPSSSTTANDDDRVVSVTTGDEGDDGTTGNAVGSSSFVTDTGPLFSDCSCPVCCDKLYSRAYLSHLLATNEILGQILLIKHNVYVYRQFINSL